MCISRSMMVFSRFVRIHLMCTWQYANGRNCDNMVSPSQNLVYHPVLSLGITYPIKRNVVFCASLGAAAKQPSLNGASPTFAGSVASDGLSRCASLSSISLIIPLSEHVAEGRCLGASLHYSLYHVLLHYLHELACNAALMCQRVSPASGTSKASRFALDGGLGRSQDALKCRLAYVAYGKNLGRLGTTLDALF